VQIPFFNTQMGKGSVAGGSGLYMGTAALSERDYVHYAIDRADLIISIGHDTVEKPPFIMGPKGPTVLHVGYLPATVEEVFFPHAGSWAMSGRALVCWPIVSRAGCRGRARCLACARRSLHGSPIARRRAATRQPRSTSCTTCGR